MNGIVSGLLFLSPPPSKVKEGLILRLTLYLLPTPRSSSSGETSVKEEYPNKIDVPEHYVSSSSEDDFVQPRSSDRKQTKANFTSSNAKTSTNTNALLVDCPTCWLKFSIETIEEHADICAQTVEHFEDPLLLSMPGSQDNNLEKGTLKEEICHLGAQMKGETIRVTVRRKQLWHDFRRARDTIYSPSQPIKVTFCGEPAIDDGGPKREFFCDLLEYIKKRLFLNGSLIQATLALAKDEFRVAGEIMAMSIAQGGPAPNFLSQETYSIISRSFIIDNCHNQSFKEICKKLMDADNENISDILMEDDVLDILDTVGYNGVPSKENKDSVKKIVESICFHDQIPSEIMPSILQLEEGLKTYGLLKSIRSNQTFWVPIFTKDDSSGITATQFLDQLLVQHSEFQVQKHQEIDVYYNFTSYIQSLDKAGLELLFKWAVGSKSILPLGLPKKITIQFLHGCGQDCRCRPTTSTCDLVITLPVHLDNENDMKEIMASAIADCDGFGLI